MSIQRTKLSKSWGGNLASYAVKITPAALRDASEYVDFILKQSHDSLPASNWWNRLLDAIDSLSKMSARCPRIPEQESFRRPIHQLVYASHRIIFRISKKEVEVLRVYHSALRPLKSLRQRAKHGKPA